MISSKFRVDVIISSLNRWIPQITHRILQYCRGSANQNRSCSPFDGPQSTYYDWGLHRRDVPSCCLVIPDRLLYSAQPLDYITTTIFNFDIITSNLNKNRLKMMNTTTTIFNFDITTSNLNKNRSKMMNNDSNEKIPCLQRPSRCGASPPDAGVAG